MKQDRSGTPSALAHSPDTGPGSTLRRGPAVLYAVLALTLLGPGPAAAQDTGGRAARAALEAAFGATAVRGKPAPFGGGGGLLDLGTPLRFGGAGWVLLAPRSIPGGSNHYDLRVAYGGVLLDAPIGSLGRTSLSVRALFGVGTAKVSLPIVGTLIGADNFGVVEPEIHGTVRLIGGLGLTVECGYRGVFGVEDLPGVGAVDLRGPSVRLGVVLGNFRTSSE